MKISKKCNVIVTVALCSMFLLVFPVHAQTTISDNPLSIFKDILPNEIKDVIDIADQAQKKLESKFGIDIQKLTTEGVNAGSSEKITPEYTKNLLERVSGLISSTNPADAPDFVGRATDIIRQFFKYIIGIMRQIIDMI